MHYKTGLLNDFDTEIVCSKKKFHFVWPDYLEKSWHYLLGPAEANQKPAPNKGHAMAIDPQNIRLVMFCV
jgi:hypothetical protein